ncbi:hypothetical protein RZS08_28370, partial [Arthrospira platensis SPKY1]|nr:hypothetical protein [Arthrospira platensis SPKY1]
RLVHGLAGQAGCAMPLRLCQQPGEHRLHSEIAAARLVEMIPSVGHCKGSIRPLTEKGDVISAG